MGDAAFVRIRCVPPLTGGLLSFASPKESSQRKGDPTPPPGRWPGSLRCSTGRAAAELASAGLRQSSPTSPGPSPLLGGAEGRELQNRREPEAQAHQTEIGFDLPALCGAEQRRAGRKKGEHCLSPPGRVAQPPPRPARVAQGTPRSGAPNRARLLFGYFFLARQEKVTRPSGAKHGARSPKRIKIPSTTRPARTEHSSPPP